MSCPREEREELEKILVGPYGVRAVDSKGRKQPEEECAVRTCFQRDVDRITHSKAFRRLKHKTQVFLQPEGDHYRTRLTHTLEVTRLARTVARALRLNEDLCEAIGLGHDLGHTPFGHAGERALNLIYPGGFKHYEQSLRVVDVLERDGRGLNLCYETRMGILNHTLGAPDDTREAGGEIRMSDEMGSTFRFFHSFMYSDIYTNPVAKGEESKVEGILRMLYDHYTAHPEKLPEDFGGIIEREGVERAAVDYISGMTDSYAMEKFGEIYIPFAWTVK